MDKESYSVFQFENYKVNSLQCILNPNFRFEKPIDIDFSLDVEIGIDKNVKGSYVTLNITVFKNAVELNYPFTIHASVTGFFKTSENVTPEQLHEFSEINGTAILFPYLRSIVTDITRVSNIEPPLILPVINVYNFIKRKQNTNRVR